MLIKGTDHIPASEITPPEIFLKRRKFMELSLGAAALSLLPEMTHAEAEKLKDVKASSKTDTNEKLTPYDSVTTYNNFYEFGTSKDDPARNAGTLKTRPWSITLDGEVKQPKVIDIEKILKLATLEERIYRFRCVEAWSMVVPWVGFSLSELLKQVEPLGSAKFVEFTTLIDPVQMPGQSTSVLSWPYREGLRLDEAMHPLTLLTLGLYGEVLPNQNGAPVRIIVPWKYGFKSAKSIVRIRFTDKQPRTTWNDAASDEYGFYSNVNPLVDHPRWTQAKERRLGDFFKRPTLPFNGYGDQVASLYSGMDLVRNF